jgi:DNA mismatch endonuclease (patch repair protein)
LPELAVRRLLHRQGLRYLVDVAPMNTLRRKADIVFTRARVAVFIDGCYWHGCPDHCRLSGRNVDWWTEKVTGTRQRDSDTDVALTAAGWEVIRAWEHEDPSAVAAHVDKVVRARSA